MQNNRKLQSNYENSIKSFADLNLKENLLRGNQAYGFEKPSAIQKQAIPHVLEGYDMIAQAQSGSGKTATFSISVLQSINTQINETQAIILAPTRELAQQTHMVIVSLAVFMEVKCYACIGGRNVRDDIKNLESGMHVVVGTPGRVKDMIMIKHIKTNFVKIFVLDEADVMLSLGFQDAVCACIGYLETITQLFLLYATLPEKVKSVANAFMKDPVEILVKKNYH